MNYNTSERLFQLLDELPDWYRTMILAIPIENMAISTKVGYCRDVIYFFQYLSSANPVYKRHTPKDFTLDDLESLTPSDANEYSTHLQSHYGASTLSRKLAAVSSMYIELARYNKVKSNPFSAVRRPKRKKNVITYLTEKEQERLFQVIESGEGKTERQLKYHKPERDKALYSLFLDTGMRVSEIESLDVVDLDFDECSCIVVRKGGNKEMLYFGDATASYLQDYLASKDPYYDDSIALFTGEKGTRFSVRSIEDLTNKYAQIAFPNKHISPHKLRSTFAMNFYAQEHDLLLLKDKMGHQNITTTNIYAEAENRRMKETRNWREGYKPQVSNKN